MSVNSNTPCSSVSYSGGVCCSQCFILEVKSRPALCDRVVVFIYLFFQPLVMCDCCVVKCGGGILSLSAGDTYPAGVCPSMMASALPSPPPWVSA